MDKQILHADAAKRAGGIVAVIRDQNHNVMWEGDTLYGSDDRAIAEAHKKLTDVFLRGEDAIQSMLDAYNVRRCSPD